MSQCSTGAPLLCDRDCMRLLIFDLLGAMVLSRLRQGERGRRDGRARVNLEVHGGAAAAAPDFLCLSGTNASVVIGRAATDAASCSASMRRTSAVVQ
jgi:hypothetical protein